ncbi:MAG: MerR family transcriptional regulator [Pseudomonadota bacterium]
MRISEAAARSGLSADTIRYYERSAVLPPLPRGADGHRDVPARMVELMTLLHLLRETGMPMADLRRFTGLFRQGDATVAARRALLEAHGARLKARRAALDRCEVLLARKMEVYDQIEGRGRAERSGP